MLLLLAPATPAAAEVNLELRPATQGAFAGDTVELGLYAVSADGTDQDVGLVGAVLNWDPSALSLLGRVDNGPFAWSTSSFPSGGAGLNDDWTDGDAYYQAIIDFQGTRATADADGLLVTTLQFSALTPLAGTTAVSIVSCGGTTCSRVLDRHPFEAGVTDITGTLGSPADVTIHCRSAAECDDENPCTDDACDAADLCGNTPDDSNDPNDGLFCNGFESGCSDGKTKVDPGSIPDCDDELTCTLDSCNETADECDHTIEEGHCLIAGTCYAAGAPDPSNDCAHCDPVSDPTDWTPRASGTPCGSQGDDPCDHADTCDGLGTCLANIEPAGTPCGSSTDTSCTDPDTCDGGGACLRNHAPEGTSCNDDLFCTVTDTCQSGACVGAGARCPVTQVCNETLDQCKAVNLEWRDVTPQPVVVGDSLEVDLYAVSATSLDQQLSTISVIVTWNPSRLRLIERVDTSPYNWLASYFPNDSGLDGLNDSFDDGNALYQALGQTAPDPVATATPAGLLVTTLRFETLAPGETFVNITAHFGTSTDTRVLDIDPPGLDITGTLGRSATVDVVECVTDADCDDDQFCTGVEGCVGNECQPSTPPDCSDGVFCNGREICDFDQGCISPGNPCPMPATCDENADNCGGCEAPTVVGEGPRYLAVTPPAGSDPVAMKLIGDPGDSDVSCLDLHIQADGSLGPLPAFLTPGEWSTVHVTGLAVQPSRTYLVHTDCAYVSPGLLSAGTPATTWVWGDVNNDGQSRLSDVGIVLDASQGSFSGGTTVPNVDLAPCWPDGIIDAQDNAAVQDAFGGDPFPCPAVCSSSGAKDNCPYAALVAEGTFNFDTSAADTDGPGAPVGCAASDPQIHADAWYCYTPSCTGTATASLCGSGFDTKLAVYSGCACPTDGSALACNDNACGLQSEVTFPVETCHGLRPTGKSVPQRSYLLRAGGFQGASGLATLTITCDAGPPATDCNGNGVPDACDITAGDSSDANANGVPDECDPGIPAASAWGVVILGLLLLVAGTLRVPRAGFVGRPR